MIKQHIFTVIALTVMSTSSVVFSAPFENADDMGKMLLAAADMADNEKILELLNAKANVNYIHANGGTPLIIAVIQGHASTVKILVDAGANVDYPLPYGATPLLWSAFKGHEDTTKILIDAGADFNHVCDGSITALTEAVKNGHSNTLKILLSAGANPLSDDEIGSCTNEQRSIRPEIIRHIQHQTNQERRQALGQWCNYINMQHTAPRDIQRLIVRDILGTVPEQMPF